VWLWPIIIANQYSSAEDVASFGSVFHKKEYALKKANDLAIMSSLSSLDIEAIWQWTSQLKLGFGLLYTLFSGGFLWSPLFVSASWKILLVIL
jgi:hypothetical protein